MEFAMESHRTRLTDRQTAVASEYVEAERGVAMVCQHQYNRLGMGIHIISLGLNCSQTTICIPQRCAAVNVGSQSYIAVVHQGANDVSSDDECIER